MPSALRSQASSVAHGTLVLLMKRALCTRGGEAITGSLAQARCVQAQAYSKE